MPKKMKAPKLPSLPALRLPTLNTKNITILALVVLGAAVVIYAMWGRLPSTQENFDANSSDPTVALFYAPWCGHCQSLKPTWNKLEQENPSVCQSVDCDANPSLAKTHNIKGFPTIKFLPNGLSNPDGAVEYDGERSEDGIKDFIKANIEGIPDPTSENPMPTDGNTMPVDPAGAGVQTTSFVGRNIMPN